MNERVIAANQVRIHGIHRQSGARTIARALNLNEDLAEAISLGHDIVHAPFGHAGYAIVGIWG